MADRNDHAESLPDLVRDVVSLVVDYARQETVEPIKGLGRFLAFGMAAVVVGGLGIVLLVLGGIRLLQAETGSTFTGHWSWFPYASGFLACVILAAGALKARGGRSR